MSKEIGGIRKSAAKAGPVNQHECNPPRVFLADFDGTEFERFHQYRRAFLEMNPQADVAMDPPKGLVAATIREHLIG